MLIKKILGKEVLDTGGDLVGRVSDMEIDLVTGTIRQIFIKSGFTHRSSVKHDDIITAGDRIIIRKRKPNTKKIETFHFLGIKRRMLCNW
ncbi:MAG: PRC-barrel domain-containing protein [Dehalococcoidia bacterium]|nr:PRC-barrel domain-containing protein [Dehalococcoidia bacterium]MDD5493849.1 PRC-barrel domain-containing protein [Dehalococcoidia bacterium]